MKFFIIANSLLLLFFGCSSGSPGQDEPKVDKDFELVSYLTNDLVNPKVQILKKSTSRLSSEISLACSGAKEVDVKDLQLVWIESMDSFHYLEVFLFGPILIEDENKIDDDNEIKRLIYSLHKPDAQKNSIDKEITKASKALDKYKPRENTKAMGLDALEYVFFAEMEGQQKLNSSSIQCSYLKYTSTELTARVQKLENEWTQKVILPLQTPKGKVSVRKYLDQLNKGLISFSDKTLKDRKLAVPLGIEISGDAQFFCELGVDCHLDYLEHRFSLRAYDAMDIHLTAISEAFSSGAKENSGFGYGRYLGFSSSERNKVLKSLSQRVFSKNWKTLPKAEQYYTTFASYDGSDSSDNLAFQSFLEIKKITDWLKTDFVIELNAELPGNVQGDSD